MGKKVLRKKRQSQSQHSSVNKAVATSVRASLRAAHGHNNLIDSWKNLQNPWITIENPSKEQTNRKFIRVRTNDYFGNPKIAKDKIKE